MKGALIFAGLLGAGLLTIGAMFAGFLMLAGFAQAFQYAFATFGIIPTTAALMAVGAALLFGAKRIEARYDDFTR